MTNSDLSKYFNYVYKCQYCLQEYGSDSIEKKEGHTCPLCSDRGSRFRKKNEL